MKWLLLPALWLCMAACNGHTSSPPAETVPAVQQVSQTSSAATPTKPILVDKDKDWGGNISLKITGSRQVTPQLMRYQLLSSYAGAPAGFDLEVSKVSGSFVSNGIRFISTGAASNQFLQALAGVYGLDAGRRSFADTVTVTYADLAAMGGGGAPAAAQYKLFFPSDYATPELYLDIDEKNGSVSLLEKDSTYRRSIIKAFSKR